jgi:hypothetical protein
MRFEHARQPVLCKTQAASGQIHALDHSHQIVRTARDLRISRSAIAALEYARII